MTGSSKSTIKVLFSKRMAASLLMGFSSGLPLGLTGGTMQAWMKEAGVDLTVIGFFAAVSMPYTLKFLWAPLFDRFSLPFLGRRRGWLVVTQLLLTAAIALMALSQPAQRPWLLAAAAFMVSFFSASQDIVVDSYRRESLADEELGLGLSLYVGGYRVAMLIASAGALFLADRTNWQSTYLIMASLMSVGIVTSFFSDEPEVDVPPPKNLRETIVEPFMDFFTRKDAFWILAFILLYKAGESMATTMTTPMYLELGFTKSEIGAIVKGFGFTATLLGAFVGGLLILRLGRRRSLFYFGILQGAAIMGFALLARVGHDLSALSAAIFAENFSSGMATAAFTTLIAGMTNKRFTATQYALLTSLTAVARTLFAMPTGYMAKEWGWVTFFAVCTALTVPALWLLFQFDLPEEKQLRAK